MTSRMLRTLCAMLIATQAAAIAGGQPPPVTDLSGTWTLDTYLSDHPEQVSASIRVDFGEPAAPMLGGLEGGGRFGRGMGRRGEPGQPGTNRSNSTPTPEEQRALDDVTAPIRYPAATLQISQTATAVTLGDPRGQSHTVQTNGKREQQQFDSARAEVAARWEGPQLVVDYDIGKGRKMTYTYSIVPTTKQLLIRIAFERAPNQPGPFEVKLVYDRGSAS